MAAERAERGGIRSEAADAAVRVERGRAREPLTGTWGARRHDTLPHALRPAWAEIDLGALQRNLATLRRAFERTGDPARILAVIKADAYGHGAPEVSRALERAGVDVLGAALLEEGAEVRRAGVTVPILVLGVAQAEQLPYFRRYDLMPVLSGMDQLVLWRDWLAGPGGYTQPIHLQVDTGMTRLGIHEEEVPEALEIVRRSPHLELAGFLSHFAEADLLESPRNPEQERRFAAMVEALTPEERSRALVHLANTAGALHRPASRYDLVRVGLSLYGYDSAAVFRGLEPVMAVKTRIVMVREIAPGTRVCYGGKWTARRPSRIGVLPVGYADGYSWRLSGTAEALVRGRRVPVVGSVSMDMIHVDLTDLTDPADPGGPVGTGEEVVLLGRQRGPGGDEWITVHDLAAQVETLPYELLCLLGLRLARRYVGDGAGASVRSRFEGGLR
ncbi:MAG: alanine racemase [Acidobacteriota bacterium]